MPSINDDGNKRIDDLKDLAFALRAKTAVLLVAMDAPEASTMSDIQKEELRRQVHKLDAGLKWLIENEDWYEEQKKQKPN